ncbi:MAG: hypothetical protein KME13_11850 [Myxacorys californica WJT36-NPBG1]|jgi:hypothetical protein|nr:hypothetical protein [Myxacorys californica WJT36-NPBG1]
MSNSETGTTERVLPPSRTFNKKATSYTANKETTMPFTPPFRNYVSGDWFYGLSGGRGKLVEQLTGRTAANLANVNTPVFIDQLLIDFGKNNVPTINKDFAAYLRESDKTQEIVQPDDLGASSSDDVVANLIWRRKSKAALQFLVKHNHFVHFALDVELVGHMNDVVTKPEVVNFSFGPKYNFKLEDGFKLRIITFAELRFAYRNRGDADFQKRIQFWWGNGQHTFTQGPPPWEVQPDLWAQYKPESEKSPQEAIAISSSQTLFPSIQLGLNYALSNEPILLNGMKVIFDQPVGVYPVTLESKVEEQHNGNGR